MWISTLIALIWKIKTYFETIHGFCDESIANVLVSVCYNGQGASFMDISGGFKIEAFTQLLKQRFNLKLNDFYAN